MESMKQCSRRLHNSASGTVLSKEQRRGKKLLTLSLNLTATRPSISIRFLKVRYIMSEVVDKMLAVFGVIPVGVVALFACKGRNVTPEKGHWCRCPGAAHNFIGLASTILEKYSSLSAFQHKSFTSLHGEEQREVGPHRFKCTVTLTAGEEPFYIPDEVRSHKHLDFRNRLVLACLKKTRLGKTGHFLHCVK